MFHRPSIEDVEKIKTLADKVYLVKDKVSQQNFVLKELEEKPGKKLFTYLLGNYIFNHEAILSFHDFDIDHDPATILIDYCPNGSLDQYINSLTITKKLIILVGIASAMKYLHSKNVLHYDLRTSNILLDENYHPKIINIGSPKKIDLQKDFKINIPPETLLNHIYDEKSEVYCYGLLAYEVITGLIPYFGFTCHQLIVNLQQKYRPQIPNDVPFVLKELIEKCWNNDPKERPTFEQIYMFINNTVYLEEMMRIWKNTHSS